MGVELVLAACTCSLCFPTGQQALLSPRAHSSLGHFLTPFPRPTTAFQQVPMGMAQLPTPAEASSPSQQSSFGYLKDFCYLQGLALLLWELSGAAAYTLRCAAGFARCFCCETDDAAVAFSPEQSAESRRHVFMNIEN